MAPSKLLVVDDEVSVERLIRQRFRKEIQNGEFDFLFAFDGTEAVELLKVNPDIDIVITDINMPKMDGLTLLNHIQELNPITKTIMISAYGDLDNIRASMNRGAFDFVTKPIDFEDLRKTMQKTLSFVEGIKSSLRSSKENQLLKMYVNPSVIGYLSTLAGDNREVLAGVREVLDNAAARYGSSTGAGNESGSTEAGDTAATVVAGSATTGGSGASVTHTGHGGAAVGAGGSGGAAGTGDTVSASLAPAGAKAAVLDEPDNSERVHGTVLFADVCGFTSISEVAAPEVITRLLNDYFDSFTRVALQHDGLIDKFLGDAAMVVFHGPNHLERAAKCSIGIREEIRKRVGKTLSADVTWPDISIGLSTGEMVRGSFGSRTLGRLDFTVIGDTVNTAARLEGISKPGDILITGEAAKHLNSKYELQEIGDLRLRNKSNPMKVYNLLSERSA